MIPYGKQDINDSDIEAVVEVLRSSWITQGPKVPEFELAMANYTGASYASAFSSATSALHVACIALGLEKGDWLWTTPISFVASANCGRYCGASIDFVDIDPQTANLCPQYLEQKLKRAKIENKLPKVVVPVHLAGSSCEMEKIKSLSDEYGFYIIEDASHAIGGKYQNAIIGGCQYSDITVFSFHPVKIITTAEGGVATTNSFELSRKMSFLRSHGVTRDSDLMVGVSDGDWYYQQIDLGYNYRMTDIQAALGINQLKRVDQFVKTRNELANRYDQMLVDLPLILPVRHSGIYSALHLYLIRIDKEQTEITRKDVFDTLRKKGVGVNVHYIPIHTQPYYQKLGFKQGDFPNAEAYYQQAITLPLFHLLKHQEQDYIVSTLKNILKNV